MERREFVKACTVLAAAGQSEWLFAADAKPKLYTKAKLVDLKGNAIKAASLRKNTNYVFHYPFASTPCFLLKLAKPVAAPAALKTEAGTVYAPPGGIGKERNLVAFSAICAHKLTYPTKQVSFISFREGPGQKVPDANVIHCCSDNSVYDPYAGGRVVSGPAPQPLAAILLEHDAASDELHALGTFGGEKFDEFFQKFEFRLQLEMGKRAKEAISDTTVLAELAQFCQQNISC